MTYVYPLDRPPGYFDRGWDPDHLIEEAEENGYLITKTMLVGWVRNGKMPPPKGKKA